MGDDRLDSLRASIDNIDAAVVHMLAERFKITEGAGLDPAFTEKFLRFVVAEVIQHHRRIAEADPSGAPAPQS
ncbi:MAG: hypothetical protein VW552_00730 [Ilumatobacter sp.]